MNSFMFSIGILINNNKIDALGNPVGGAFNINGVSYTASEVGTLKGTVDFNPLAPYIGFGWDTTFDRDKKFGFTLEFGGAYQGIPEADLSASGPVTSNAAFMRNLASEEAELQKSLNLFKVFPLISFGIIYRF
ncbi:MAG: hypothetical protein ACE5DW_03790 [Thermodesulfobacteriota bacterium]